MADLFTKPDKMNEVWAENGDKVYPGADKVNQGWVEEVPPHEYFNFMDNKRDNFLAHVNQFGIPQHDMQTQYQGLQSLTMGSDGNLYKCLVTNVGQDPVTALQGYWEFVPLGIDDISLLQRYIGYQFYSSDFTAQAYGRYYLTAPLRSTLPTNDRTTVTYSKTPTVTATIVAPAGYKILTTQGRFDELTFDLDDEINFTLNGTDWEI